MCYLLSCAKDRAKVQKKSDIYKFWSKNMIAKIRREDEEELHGLQNCTSMQVHLWTLYII